MVPEPYRIKTVEPISRSSRTERETWLDQAKLNPFRLGADQVYIDLLTDSGTGAMSDEQWAGVMRADESYSGSSTWYELEESVRETFGKEHVIPAHQGRSAEFALFNALLDEGDKVPSNTHFDTTSAHIQHCGATPVDLLTGKYDEIHEPHPFKGDLDTARLRSFMKKEAGAVPLVTSVLTCNSAGGQPVSYSNLEEVSEICREFDCELWLDASRIMENAFFIQRDEEGMGELSIPEIVRALADLADGVWMSGKKDGLANMGALICCDSEEHKRAISEYTVLIDGYTTYGGMSGRDMAALARGIREALSRDYLEHRVGQVERLVERLDEGGVPVMRPAGGHAAYIDAREFFPHLEPREFPGWALSLHGYLAGGVRSVEIGPILRGRHPATGENRFDIPDLVRLAVPRRVYTENQLDYAADVFIELYESGEQPSGIEFTWEAPRLRHFTSEFAWRG